MKNVYKSEVEPNKKTAMCRYVGGARWPYNWGLERIKEVAANGESRPSAVELQVRQAVARRDSDDTEPFFPAIYAAVWRCRRSPLLLEGCCAENNVNSS